VALFPFWRKKDEATMIEAKFFVQSVAASSATAAVSQAGSLLMEGVKLPAYKAAGSFWQIKTNH
jgi:hypothetical protein